MYILFWPQYVNINFLALIVYINCTKINLEYKNIALLIIFKAKRLWFDMTFINAIENLFYSRNCFHADLFLIKIAGDAVA